MNEKWVYATCVNTVGLQFSDCFRVAAGVGRLTAGDVAGVRRLPAGVVAGFGRRLTG